MKLVAWLVLAIGALIFFEAPDQLMGWIGMMVAVGAASYLVYKWGRNTGYLPDAEDVRDYRPRPR